MAMAADASSAWGESPADAKARGAAIREARERQGVSQAALARRLGTTQQTIARWEQGQRPQPRWRPQIKAFLADPDRSHIRLAVPSAEGPLAEPAGDPPLGPRQERVLDAFLLRVEQGDPLTAAEARAFQTAFSAAGLEPPPS